MSTPINHVILQIEKADGIPKQTVRLNVIAVLTEVDRDLKTKFILALKMEELLSTLKAIKTENTSGRRTPSSKRKKRAR